MAECREDCPQLAIRPYPRELEECVVLRDSRQVTLRPIRPEDEPAHYKFLEQVSDEDMRMRFFGVVRRDFDHKDMSRFTQINYDREMAFIATAVGESGTPETLGVVRTSTKPDNSEAEFAILIRSDLKGTGLGPCFFIKLYAIQKNAVPTGWWVRLFLKTKPCRVSPESSDLRFVKIMKRTSWKCGLIVPNWKTTRSKIELS